jgi:uncharacterized damage-inducible protein DinB
LAKDMDQTDASALIAYNFWANDRILSACERLSVDDFTRVAAPDPGWGSLRGILVHALDAEYGWRSVLQGQDATDILDEADFADVAALKARWAAERAAWLDYVAGVGVDDLNRGTNSDPERSPKVWQTIMHVVNHGTQHRSEAAAILTGYGRSPGELDFDLFLAENPEHMHPGADPAPLAPSQTHSS